MIIEWKKTSEIGPPPVNRYVLGWFECEVDEGASICYFNPGYDKKGLFEYWSENDEAMAVPEYWAYITPPDFKDRVYLPENDKRMEKKRK